MQKIKKQEGAKTFSTPLYLYIIVVLCSCWLLYKSMHFLQYLLLLQCNIKWQLLLRIIEEKEIAPNKEQITSQNYFTSPSIKQNTPLKDHLFDIQWQKMTSLLLSVKLPSSAKQVTSPGHLCCLLTNHCKHLLAANKHLLHLSSPSFSFLSLQPLQTTQARLQSHCTCSSFHRWTFHRSGVNHISHIVYVKIQHLDRCHSWKWTWHAL